MEDLKVGDIIYFIGDELEPVTYKEEIRGIAGKILFIRTITEKGFGDVSFADIEDLKTFGWKKL